MSNDRILEGPWGSNASPHPAEEDVSPADLLRHASAVLDLIGVPSEPEKTAPPAQTPHLRVINP